MSLIGDPQDVVTDSDGRLGKTVRHIGGVAVIGAGRGMPVAAVPATTVGCDGRFEGRFAA